MRIRRGQCRSRRDGGACDWQTDPASCRATGPIAHCERAGHRRWRTSGWQASADRPSRTSGWSWERLSNMGGALDGVVKDPARCSPKRLAAAGIFEVQRTGKKEKSIAIARCRPRRQPLGQRFPYLGSAYDLDQTGTIYASYTGIFSRQSAPACRRQPRAAGGGHECRRRRQGRPSGRGAAGNGGAVPNRPDQPRDPGLRGAPPAGRISTCRT